MLPAAEVVPPGVLSPPVEMLPPTAVAPAGPPLCPAPPLFGLPPLSLTVPAALTVPPVVVAPPAPSEFELSEQPREAARDAVMAKLRILFMRCLLSLTSGWRRGRALPTIPKGRTLQEASIDLLGRLMKMIQCTQPERRAIS
jgi:hypothetical protein